MRRILPTVLMLLLVGVSYGRDIVTKRGVTYRDASVIGVDANGLRVMYVDGVATIPARELPPDLLSQFSSEIVAKRLALAKANASRNLPATPEPPHSSSFTWIVVLIGLGAVLFLISPAIARILRSETQSPRRSTDHMEDED